VREFRTTRKCACGEGAAALAKQVAPVLLAAWRQQATLGKELLARKTLWPLAGRQQFEPQRLYIQMQVHSARSEQTTLHNQAVEIYCDRLCFSVLLSGGVAAYSFAVLLSGGLTAFFFPD
jgi:hypothetical protein